MTDDVVATVTLVVEHRRGAERVHRQSVTLTSASVFRPSQAALARLSAPWLDTIERPRCMTGCGRAAREGTNLCEPCEADILEVAEDYEREGLVYGHAVLVWCDGRHLTALHLRSVNGMFDRDTFVDEHDPWRDGDRPPVGFGLWVWEGGAKWVQCDPEYQDFDIVMRGEWRRPTAVEMQAMADGRDPFEEQGQ